MLVLSRPGASDHACSCMLMTEFRQALNVAASATAAPIPPADAGLAPKCRTQKNHQQALHVGQLIATMRCAASYLTPIRLFGWRRAPQLRLRKLAAIDPHADFSGIFGSLLNETQAECAMQAHS